MRNYLIGVVAFFAAGLTGLSMAEEGDSSVAQNIKTKIQRAVPNLPIVNISVSKLDGFYEIELANGERLFSTASGDYFIAGDLFQVGSGSLVNLSEEQRNGKRADKLAAVTDEQKIVFSPNQKKASVTVFTDVDCGYCRKLHLQMAGYLEQGIEIKYMAFPRAGVGSSSYTKIVSAWCADDRQDAITKLKTGKTIAELSCDNPVAEHFRLGNELGVTGTPALVLESGKMVPGFVEPARLAKILGI